MRPQGEAAPTDLLLLLAETALAGLLVVVPDARAQNVDTSSDATVLPAINLFNSKTNQISYAYGSLIKSDSLYNLCFPARIAPAAVCQNGVMDHVVHPVEPLAVRLTLAGTF